MKQFCWLVLLFSRLGISSETPVLDGSGMRIGISVEPRAMSSLARRNLDRMARQIQRVLEAALTSAQITVYEEGVASHAAVRDIDADSFRRTTAAFKPCLREKTEGCSELRAQMEQYIRRFREDLDERAQVQVALVSLAFDAWKAGQKASGRQLLLQAARMHPQGKIDVLDTLEWDDLEASRFEEEITRIRLPPSPLCQVVLPSAAEGVRYQIQGFDFLPGRHLIPASQVLSVVETSREGTSRYARANCEDSSEISPVFSSRTTLKSDTGTAELWMQQNRLQAWIVLHGEDPLLGLVVRTLRGDVTRISTQVSITAQGPISVPTEEILNVLRGKKMMAGRTALATLDLEAARWQLPPPLPETMKSPMWVERPWFWWIAGGALVGGASWVIFRESDTREIRDGIRIQLR